MCSKKWANPVLPGSNSLRDPVWTGICTETTFGNPVRTAITFKPLASVFSTGLSGRMSRVDEERAASAAEQTRSKQPRVAATGSVRIGAPFAAIAPDLQVGPQLRERGEKLCYARLSLAATQALLGRHTSKPVAQTGRTSNVHWRPNFTDS